MRRPLVAIIAIASLALAIGGDLGGAEAQSGQKKLFNARWDQSLVNVSGLSTSYNHPIALTCDGSYTVCADRWNPVIGASLADWNSQPDTARFIADGFFDENEDVVIRVFDKIFDDPNILGIALTWDADGNFCPLPTCATFRWGEAWIGDDGHAGAYGTGQARQATITHELGHLLSLRHESVNADESQLYDCGFDDTGEIPPSVMSYDCIDPLVVGGFGIYSVQDWDVCGVNHAYPPPAGAALPPAPPAYYHPVTPARILDTRPAPFGPIGGAAGRLGHGCVKSVQVTDVAGVPGAESVSAVVVNVTATQPTLPSHLTIYPSGTSLPNAANLNFVAGQTVPNLVTVRVGTDGRVNVFNNSGQVHLIFDIVGWYGESTGGSRYNPITPKRILDTRSVFGGPIGYNEAGGLIPPGKVGPGGILTVDVTNRYDSGVPDSDVTAVVMNVTVTEPTAPSHLTVYPSDEATAPNAANLNFVAGQTVPNLVIVKVGPAGGGSVRVRNNSGSTHVIFDIVGWYSESSGDVFTPLSPARIMDTRPPPFGPIGWPSKLGHAGTATVDVTNTYSSGVPASGVTAVIVNTTVTEPTAPSHLTIYPPDVARPNAANLNFVAGQTVPNLVMVRVPTSGPYAGMVNVYNNSGQTHAIFDVAGYFAPPP